MATTETPRGDQKVLVRGDVVGSHHPHRRVAGHHEDRLLQPVRAPEVLLDVDDLPGLRHLHEGDRPARRPSSPAASAVCGETLHMLVPEPEHGLRRQAAAVSRSTWPSLRTTCSTTRSSTTAWRTWTSASRWSRNQPVAAGQGREHPAPHSDAHGYKTIADIMRALNPFTGEFYLGRCTSRATRARCTSCSAAVTPSVDDHARRLQRRHHPPDVHRLLRAADARSSTTSAHGADLRRPVRPSWVAAGL